MRSPLTNTDENAGICSESVELTQRFTKSFQVWEMVGGKWLRGGWGAGDRFAEDERNRLKSIYWLLPWFPSLEEGTGVVVRHSALQRGRR